jgi:hypothetical protein
MFLSSKAALSRSRSRAASSLLARRTTTSPNLRGPAAASSALARRITANSNRILNENSNQCLRSQSRSSLQKHPTNEFVHSTSPKHHDQILLDGFLKLAPCVPENDSYDGKLYKTDLEGVWFDANLYQGRKFTLTIYPKDYNGTDTVPSFVADPRKLLDSRWVWKVYRAKSFQAKYKHVSYVVSAEKSRQDRQCLQLVGNGDLVAVEPDGDDYVRLAYNEDERAYEWFAVDCDDRDTAGTRVMVKLFFCPPDDLAVSIQDMNHAHILNKVGFEKEAKRECLQTYCRRATRSMQSIDVSCKFALPAPYRIRSVSLIIAEECYE